MSLANTIQVDRDRKTRLIRWAPVVSVCLALLLVAFVCFWGVRSEWQHRRDSVYASIINEARSHAERTGVRIEMELEEGRELAEFRQNSIPRWLSRHWRQAVRGKEQRLYGAVTDVNHRILCHSSDMNEPAGTIDPARRLRDAWNREPLPEYGPGVHHVRDLWLTQNADAIDITIPFQYAGQVVGYYHSGVEREWLDRQVAAAQRDVVKGWSGIIASIGLIVLLTSISLYRLGAHTIKLEQAIGHLEAKRLADLSKLIVGMAHELRNPLNAVRLNLFTSEKLIRGETPMDQQEAVAMLRESVSEVQRVESLVEQLLGYARLDSEDEPWISLDHEIQSALSFLRQVHEHHRIQVQFDHPNDDLQVRINPKKFRQILLNLLQNARQALPEGGELRIGVTRSDHKAVVSVEDSGSGIAVDQYERIFEPFYSTRHEGVGLGLAVVKSLVENAGGQVTCERSVDLGGMNFRVTFPARVENRDPKELVSVGLEESYERNAIPSGR